MRRRLVSLRIASIFAMALPLAACSAIRSEWRDPAMAAGDKATSVMPRRLSIVGWSMAHADGAQTKPTDAKTSQVGDVLARVAADFIKLRRNYLVYDTGIVQKSFVEACRDKIDGVLIVRALDATQTAGDRVHLDLSAEVYSCQSGALVWRVEGSSNSPAKVADLAQLTDSYAASLGEASRPFVAPAFSLLQELFGALPDITLSDSEIEEKIELGMQQVASPALASTHAL